MRKFSTQFERDYEFYFSNKDRFTFSGGDSKSRVQYPSEPEPTFIDEKTGEKISIPFEVPYSSIGPGAKKCFHDLDSRGKTKSCSEPELLVQLLNCKASVNFHIKLWAEGRAEYTTSLEELNEMMEIYKAPDWVLKAVEKQKIKILKEWGNQNKYNSDFYKQTATLHFGEILMEMSDSPDVILDPNNSK